MAKIDEKLEALKKIVGFDKTGEHPKRKVKIIDDGGQLRIRIPKGYADMIKIDATKDNFEFHLIPKEEGGFELEGILIKDEGNI